MLNPGRNTDQLTFYQIYDEERNNARKIRYVTVCLAPMRVTCNEDDFSENSRCILEGWLTYIDLKHAIPLLTVHETAVTGMSTSGLRKP
jgi:hypothetical protein